MKKWLTGLFLFLVIASLCSYLFISSTLSFSETAYIGAMPSSVYRSFINKASLQRWWHGADAAQGTFNVRPQAFNIIEVIPDQDKNAFSNFITLLPLQHDSTAMVWKGQLQASMNPFVRVQQYFRMQAWRKKAAAILKQFQTFMQRDENIYNLSIQQQMVTDTLLVVTKQKVPTAPTPESYYALIKKLKTYIAASGARETNYPMLHIFPPDSGYYETMVAIPVNKRLPDNGAIVYKRMVPGKILMAEVKGGEAAVDEGFRQLEFYRTEHGLKPPALPFQSLVTDRLQEPDSSKWITRLYYPVD